MKLKRVAALVWLALLLGACAATIEPPASTSRGAPAASTFVVAANPLAAEAGMAVLRRGGSAVDAAVAIQAMLSLVEPQSSGVGGGAFMTYYDGSSRRITVYDGRETAPAGATPDMFLDAAGQPLPFPDAVLSGRATGVPGAVRMLAMAHDAHGRLPWRTLFGDAERTARDGFIVSPRLARFLAMAIIPELAAPDVRAYFARPGGGLLQAGDRLRNPAYATFLRRLAAEGPNALYAGPTARRIVARVRDGPLAGAMTLADLAAYRPIERMPLCGRFSVYRLCAPPPPASGVALIELLEMLDHTDIAARGPADPQAWFLFAEASRLMYADRDRYVGDPAFAKAPTAGLIDPDYAAARARLIGARAGPPPEPGTLPGAPPPAGDATREPGGTSHVIVGDAAGNVVSMTTTVESVFGSGRMVDGFFLNNQLTDFSFSPTDAQGRPSANAVAPGKRPRSSMTPTILIGPDGRFAGAIGSAGGNSILAFVAKSLVAAVDWRMPMQRAIATPNLVARGANFGGEVDRFAPGVVAGLAARGIDLAPGEGEDSGVHGIIVRGGMLDGGFDPRREGCVLMIGLAPACAQPGAVPIASATLAKPSRSSSAAKPLTMRRASPGPS